MTRAALRGGRYVGVQALGDLAACVREAIADGGFCYGYHGELDLLGHLYGPGSAAWRMQLARWTGWWNRWSRTCRPADCSRSWPITA